MAESKPIWKNWPHYVQRRAVLSNEDFNDPSVQYQIPDDLKIKAKDAVAWIYEVLSVLDGKASALMRLNGILIAAAAFLLGQFSRQAETIIATSIFDAKIIILAALLSAVSIVLCLFVVDVRWKFLGKVTQPTEKTLEISQEINALGKTSSTRQTIYRIAWHISLVSSFLFIVEFMKQAYIILFE